MDSTPSASASGNAIASAPSDPNQLEVRDEHREEVTDSVAAADSANSVVEKKRKKTSVVWNDFHEVKLPNGQQKAVCNYCKAKFATGGFGASTSHLRRHSESCLRRKTNQSRLKQSTIEFQPTGSTLNPFLALGGTYSNVKMREIIATSIMVHEYPFSIVEDTVWMWAFKFANSDFETVSRQTIKNDCMTLYQAEKKCLKAELMNVNRISITTDMWKSNHQVAEYMVITGHFIDSEWELQKRVLSFVKVPPPRRGVDVADAIFKCLQSWGIEISYIKGIIENVRESVKYVNHSDLRLKTFCDIVKQMGVKERKLVIDCPTRWNSTFEMLSTALIFKDVFPEYKEREPYYNYLPSAEEWSKVDKVCNLLEVFSHVTNVISGSDYPTSSLYLPEVYRVKEVIDLAIEDNDDFMREMARPMKVKFDKYRGECNLLMAIASVLDPRCKLHVVNICFPIIYKSEVEATENVEKVKAALEDLYNEYCAISLQESVPNSELQTNVNQSSLSSTLPPRAPISGFSKIMSIVREKETVAPVKSELKSYLEEGVYICDEKSHISFSALEWWKTNSLKYRILSKMARDILAVPISTVASESTFSAGGRVIDAYRASLNEETVEALICGGDWLRNKYDLKKKIKGSKR